MRRTVSVLSLILALAVFTGCTLQNVQPADVPPRDTTPYTRPSGPYIVLERPDTLYYLLDYDTYFVPEIRDAVFFVDGAWYLYHGDRWYRGRSYNGPWVYLGRGDIPPRLGKLPRDYRSKRYRKQRVPYGHWEKKEKDRPRAPDIRIQRPEYLYLLATYSVYYVPDDRHEIFYTEGSWYTRHRDTWFTGDSYRGPWSQADPRRLPGGLRKLPADYRNRSYEARRVPYGHWDKKKEKARTQPPDVRIQKPQSLYLLTPYGVYYVPDERHEIFYVDGSWYTRHRDTWYTGESYRGPWSQADPRRLPSGLRKLPDDYRSYKAKHVPFGRLEDKGKRGKDERQDQGPPDRELPKIKEPREGKLLPPGPQEPPLPKPRGEAKSDKRPEKKEKAPSRKGSDAKVNKIARPDVLRYVEKLEVYFIPEIDEEIFYFKGAWYLREKGKWLMGDSYNGPWSLMDKRKVPKRISTLPKNYRTDKYPSQEVPYGHWEGSGKRGNSKR